MVREMKQSLSWDPDVLVINDTATFPFFLFISLDS